MVRRTCLTRGGLQHCDRSTQVLPKGSQYITLKGKIPCACRCLSAGVPALVLGSQSVWRAGERLFVSLCFVVRPDVTRQAGWWAYFGLVHGYVMLVFKSGLQYLNGLVNV